MENGTLKLKIQKQIVTVSVILLLGKFFAFFLTNSVGILTDAMESIVNVIAGFISLYSLYISAKPKDSGHPFGHGKVELISASIEGILILIAGGIIVFEGIKRIFVPAEISQLDLGIWIVAISGLINYLLGWYSIRIGKKHDSIALVAGGKHLQSDTYSSVGLVLGLVLLYFTGKGWIDSGLAIVFGAIIMITGLGILRKTVENLMDKADVEILEEMRTAIIRNRKSDWIDVHNMKAVKYGSAYHVDCDLTLPWYYNIRESHAACDELQRIMAQEIGERVQLSIHSDPCQSEQCVNCALSACMHRSQPFEVTEELTLDFITQEKRK